MAFVQNDKFKVMLLKFLNIFFNDVIVRDEYNGFVFLGHFAYPLFQLDFMAGHDDRTYSIFKVFLVFIPPMFN